MIERARGGARRRMARTPAVLSVLVLSAVPRLDVLRAEGAARVLDCMLVRVCDAGGNCEAGAGHTVFRMEPIDTDSDGAGRYTLGYGDVRSDMQALSAVGPFVWATAGERHTLLASSESAFLWHALALAPSPVATIRFLECSFRQ